MEFSKTSRDSLPASLEWMTRWPGIALAFLWGFAEGTLFFILPDVPLSFVALFRPRRALLHVAAIVVGAMLAGAAMFTWSARSAGARAAVAYVPAVSPAMFEGAERDFNQYGIWGASLGPLRGIPYKVYAVEAPAHSGIMAVLAGDDPGAVVAVGGRVAGLRGNRSAAAQTPPRCSRTRSPCGLLDCDLCHLLDDGEIALAVHVTRPQPGFSLTCRYPTT